MNSKEHVHVVVIVSLKTSINTLIREKMEQTHEQLMVLPE